MPRVPRRNRLQHLRPRANWDDAAARAEVAGLAAEDLTAGVDIEENTTVGWRTLAGALPLPGATW
jgi:hypothetical protein